MAGVNPYSLKGVITHPLARMLPLYKYERQTYRLGETNPPSDLADFGPQWVVFDLVLGALATLQVRATLQEGFTLLGLTVSNSSNVSGGFRAQIYDVPRQRRLQ